MENVRVESVDSPLRRLLDQVVDGALKAQRARDDFGGQRTIAIVVEVVARVLSLTWRRRFGPAESRSDNNVVPGEKVASMQRSTAFALDPFNRD
jgi:hypothetical protein